MTTLQVVVHEPGPAWQPGIAFREQRGVEHHIATMRGWLEEGRLVMGGPFLDAEGGGMAVVAFDSLEPPTLPRRPIARCGTACCEHARGSGWWGQRCRR